MTVATAINKRYKISEGNRIDIRILNPAELENGEECERLDYSKGRVIEISAQGIRISSQHSFPFYRKLVIEFAPLEKGDKPFHAEVEVLGARPHPTHADMWANECAFTDNVKTEQIENLIHEMARRGWLDRRGSARESIDETVNSRMEASQDDYEISITDISSAGIGIFSSNPIEEGRKILIEVPDEESEPRQLTVRAIRQTEVSGGYLIGCKIIRGTIERQEDQVVPATLVPKPPLEIPYLKILNIVCMLALMAFIVREFFHLF